MNPDLSDELSRVPVTGRIFFEGERYPYSVRARNERYIVCTKPLNTHDKMLYCIVDLVEGVRGTENVVFGLGAETDEQCLDMLERLATGQSSVSKRNRAPLDVTRVSKLPTAVKKKATACTSN